MGLLLGLCTPVAALAGAGFLLSVILSQFPGSAGAQPKLVATFGSEPQRTAVVGVTVTNDSRSRWCGCDGTKLPANLLGPGEGGARGAKSYQDPPHARVVLQRGEAQQQMAEARGADPAEQARVGTLGHAVA